MRQIIPILIIGFFLSSSIQRLSAQDKKLQGQITLSGAFALYPLAVKWASDFRKLHPKVRIDISGGGAGKGITDALTGMADLGMVSREIHPDEYKKGAWSLHVAKDAVVAIANVNNPKINVLKKRGITKDAAYKMYITKQYKTWGQVLGINSHIPVHLYTRSDACGSGETWAKFLNKKQEDLEGTAVYGDPSLSVVVQKDAVAFGYNNLAFAYNLKTKRPHPGIFVVPIDLNNNGKIDSDENFYSSLNQLIEAIEKGKYPSPPARNLYLVAKGKPKKAVVVAFLNYILSEGQKENTPNGFVRISARQQREGLSRLK